MTFAVFLAMGALTGLAALLSSAAYAVPAGYDVDQFGTDLMSQSSNLTLADVDPRHPNCIGGVTERRKSSRRGDDALDHGGTVAVFIKSQRAPQGGKSPGDNRDSARCVRLAEPRLPQR